MTKSQEIKIEMKKWEKPTLSKIALKQVTLAGASGFAEHNSGQGAVSKRA